MANVTLRHKPIGKGRKSLYLDIYPPIQSETTGKPLRKFYLKLYIYNRPRSEAERLHNKETVSLAQHICLQRQIDLQNADYGFVNKTKFNSNFIEFFQAEADRRPNSIHWSMAVAYFKKFAGGVFLFKHLNETLSEGYKNYLLSSPYIGRSKRKIQKNTAAAYFSRFKSSKKKAGVIIHYHPGFFIWEEPRLFFFSICFVSCPNFTNACSISLFHSPP